MQQPSPRDYVVEPMRSALDRIVTRGLIAFALVVMAVAATVLPVGDGIRLLTYHVLPALLALYLIAHEVRRAFTRSLDDTEAWQRAGELDPGDTTLARFVAFSVPAGTLLAGAALLCPHLADADDRARVLGVFLPLFVLLWVGVTFAWTDECRGRLARAAADSDRRFRAYWTGISRT